MIRVAPAPEPPDFETQVRQPGLDALAELVGELPLRRRRGPKRTKIADRREDIPSESFPPFWTEALEELLTAYWRICAYTCFYIEPVTGAASVDHMIPKSQAWDRVYEWLNYRLACSLMNTRKGAMTDVLDPFEVQHGWFTIEFTGFQVLPAEGVRRVITAQVAATIQRLRLNDRDCRERREEYAVSYWEHQISLGYLSRRAPFVVMELRRQGRLCKGDV